MKRFFGIFWLCAMLLGAGSVHAEGDTATTESLLRKSGLWEQLGSIEAQMDAGLADVFGKVKAKPSPAELERLSKAVRDAYAVSRLRAVSLGVISGKLDARHVTELQRWYDSPLGQSISRLEEQATAEGGDLETKMRQRMKLLEKLHPARRELLERLVKETRVAEATTQIVINTSLATLRGVASVMPQTPVMSQGDLKAALEAQRPRMMQTFSTMTLASFAKTYASLSQAQLQQYVAFFESEAGSHYNALGIEALDAALTEAAADFGRRLPSTKDQANT